MREKTTATLLMILLLASALSVTLVPVLAKGGSAKGADISWGSGGKNKAIFLVTSSGLIHQWRYEPNHLHAVYKPFDKFPNSPGEGWVQYSTSGITGGFAELEPVFGYDANAQWWVYIEDQS